MMIHATCKTKWSWDNRLAEAAIRNVHEKWINCETKKNVCERKRVRKKNLTLEKYAETKQSKEECK